MKKKMMFAVVFVRFAFPTTSVALAQAGAPQAMVDTTAKTLVGTWEGSFESEHGNGAMRMVFVQDTTWKVSSTVSLQGGQEMEAVVTDFKVTGNKLAWNQSIMGMACKGAATLTAGTLRGETTCDQASIGYVLRKK